MASVSGFTVREKDFGVEVKNKNGMLEYVEKATFSIELLKHIEAGHDSGFICNIYCSLKEQSRYANCLQWLLKYIFTVYLI